MISVEEARARLEAAGQSHLLRFWPELSPGERRRFLGELAQFDPAQLRGHCRAAAEAARREPSAHDRLDRRLEPVPPEFIGGVGRSDPDTLKAWEDEGFLQISRSRVAVLLYIMTSEFTLEPTENFFKENNYFNLARSNVVMFEQRMIPAVSFDGKVILENKGKIAMAPDGNGGLYQALLDNKILEDMEKRGVQYLHVYCVDNILVKMADPVFIGFCVKKGADCGAKVVQKAHPAEPVGVVCRVGGVYQVVEYSELSPETAEKRHPDGTLVYSAGNICNHFFTLDFLRAVSEKCESKLKQHVALKKVPCVDEEGNWVKPEKPNGIKMEKFVFDVFQFSRDFVAFEVRREEEFSPLKNADTATKDTPATARRALLSQHYRWALAAGASFVDGQDRKLPPMPRLADTEDPPATCEVSPLVSYFGEGLEAILKGKELKSPLVLEEKVAEELGAQ
nr:PREDICTED: UDP-N-acetylhexosamine pyrophosphorylase-like protein 1 [Lepisosteus oculatus]